MDAKQYYTAEVHGDYQIFELGDFAVAEGGTIPNCQLAYKTFGTLNVAKDNVILVPTWFSGSHQIMQQVYVGEGRALDPGKYFIVIINQLGNGLSSAPHDTPFPRNQANFPQLRISDDVRAQHQLLTELFGIDFLALIVGGSMGAQQTYEWAARYPDMVKRAAPIAGTAQVTPHNFLLTQGLQNSIMSDPAWLNGWYEKSTDVHIGLRRLAEHCNLMGWSPAFFKKDRWRTLGFTSLEDFITRFMIGYFGPMDPNNLLVMIKKWQLGDICYQRSDNLKEALAKIKAKVFVLAIEGDLMFPPADCEHEQLMIPDSEFHITRTTDGHFALFGTDPHHLEQVDAHLKTLLATPAKISI
ncbi:MAG: alpha/beta fold hydrolase [Burkholderiales bacterium]|nr:alpha/beta fold hydrolase [Nitrosomonas sp.]MCP5274929.1 alpha/beta fold hydrolase [Burkholderiales bacterium]